MLINVKMPTIKKDTCTSMMNSVGSCLACDRIAFLKKFYSQDEFENNVSESMFEHEKHETHAGVRDTNDITKKATKKPL